MIHILLIIIHAIDLDGEEVDEFSVVDNFEDKLKDVIDGLTQKRCQFIFCADSVVHFILLCSAKGRTDCLKSLQAALSKKFICDFVYER
jgi:hypothetical protein